MDLKQAVPWKQGAHAFVPFFLFKSLAGKHYIYNHKIICPYTVYQAVIFLVKKISVF